MSDYEEHKEATYTPVSPVHFQETNERDYKMNLALMESIYSQSLGWVHTPPFRPGDLISRQLRVPRSKDMSLLAKLYFKKAFDPKVQVGKDVPYGHLPKKVATDLERRKLNLRDLPKILEVMGLDVDIIRPPLLRYREYFSVSKSYNPEGMPTQPFLDLELFDDDWLYETRTPKEWLSLGVSDKEKRPVPGMALIPVDFGEDDRHVELKWRKVGVLNYDDSKKLYLVRAQDLFFGTENSEKADLWVPRIYLKFAAEDSLKFARRLKVAVDTRHLAEESLRMCYTVENMPVQQDVPCWSEKDLNDIISVARRSKHLQPKLQWIKDHLVDNVREIQTVHKKVVNYMTYVNVTGQNPNLMADFRNERLGSVQSPYRVEDTIKYGYAFKEQFESFRGATLYSEPEVIRALLQVQSEILNLEYLYLFDFNPTEITTLDKFVLMQKEAMHNAKEHISRPWLQAIADAAITNISNCTTGDYDLNQTVVHTFQMTKLGKLLRLIGYKMQDVMRTVVMRSLDKYVMLFRNACINFGNVKDGFEWIGNLRSDKYAPLHNPVFDIAVQVKETHLEFAVPLAKYRDTVSDLFDEVFDVCKGLPRIEKFVMKKLLYNTDDKLECVGTWEKQITTWKKALVTGVNQAIIVATAYTVVYDPPLKAFEEDQINYVKRLIREKTPSDRLKHLIKHHHDESTRLMRTIPDHVDIGPFRLMTVSVRYAAVKKHEQLAGAVLDHFYDIFKDGMEKLNDEFLVLLDNIDLPTGNIEDLLEKKTWCRSVPKKVEKLAETVNQLRADTKLFNLWSKNMEDDDFAMFWKIQALPQQAMRRLDARVHSFDEERSRHKQNLVHETGILQASLRQLESDIAALGARTDPEDAAAIGAEVRQVRKKLQEDRESTQIFAMREKLFCMNPTDHSVVEALSASLAPFEALWLPASEFLRYRERAEARELDLEKGELRGKVVEFREAVAKGMEMDEGLREAGEFFLKEMDAFLESEYVVA